MKWLHQSYGSGTEVVVNTLPWMAHYYVYAEVRSRVCEDLVVWLNEGKRPSWADSLKRDEPTSEFCTGEAGIKIIATGPSSQLAYNETDGLIRDATSSLRVGLIERLFE